MDDKTESKNRKCLIAGGAAAAVLLGVAGIANAVTTSDDAAPHAMC